MGYAGRRVRDCAAHSCGGRCLPPKKCTLDCLEAVAAALDSYALRCELEELRRLVMLLCPCEDPGRVVHGDLVIKGGVLRVEGCAAQP